MFILVALEYFQTAIFYNDGFLFPIKIKISSPDEDAFEDVEVIEELLTQVYHISSADCIGNPYANKMYQLP